MNFCPPRHFTKTLRILLLVSMCFGVHHASSQTFINEPSGSYESMENGKQIQYSSITNLSNGQVEEISNLFNCLMGVDSVSYDKTTMRLTVSCIPLIKAQDLKPLFAILNMNVLDDKTNTQEILKKTNR
jgi:hypothetical protein